MICKKKQQILNWRGKFVILHRDSQRIGLDEQYKVVSLEEIFASAEATSKQMRSSLTAQSETESGISTARANRLPDINATVSVRYKGNGFTTKRNFTDYQTAPIPHFGSGAGINIGAQSDEQSSTSLEHHRHKS